MDDCALARAILVRGPRTGAKHLPCQAEAPISGQNDTWIPPLADRDAQIFRGDRPASHGDGHWRCVRLRGSGRDVSHGLLVKRYQAPHALDVLGKLGAVQSGRGPRPPSEIGEGRIAQGSEVA